MVKFRSVSGVELPGSKVVFIYVKASTIHFMISSTELKISAVLTKFSFSLKLIFYAIVYIIGPFL